MPPDLSFETVHASSIAIDGRAVLIFGPSGAGKSDLVLRLIDRGAQLVSDDYTIVRRNRASLLATAPDTIFGRIEVRGVGLIEIEAARDAPVALAVDLALPPERLPSGDRVIVIAGVEIPALGLSGLEASAPIKVEMALSRFGLVVS